MSDSPRKAEHVLAARGVFKGHHGLRGLLNAQEFWDRQNYGARIYYGDDYLHRDVLRAAVQALDEFAEQDGLAAVAREFVAYYTGPERHPDGGCGNCGGLPHSTTCFVGRFAAILGDQS